jgi:hypothetical protein
MKLCKLLLASVAATMLLGALVSSASARNFEVSNQRIRAIFSEVNFHLLGGTTECHVTIEGSLHTRTMAKVIGSLIGYITRVDLGLCPVGTATVLTSTLPWHVRYSGFQGVLPRITSIITHVIDSSFRVREPGGITCLIRSTTTEPESVNYHRNPTTGQVETAEIGGTLRTGFECFGASGSFRSDRGRLSLSNSSTVLILVSLI